MTDEEKTKKAKELVCKNCRWEECGNNLCLTLTDTIKAIDVGIDEGRKEVYEELKWVKDTDNYVASKLERLRNIETENEELKAQVKLLSEKVGFWEEQTKWKEAQIEEYDRLNMFDIARTDELQAQIEKMKRCGNCKYFTQENNYTVGTCKEKYAVEGDNICDYWELAE